MEFTTLDQVEAHYQPLISAAGDDQSRVMSLRLERADAREAIRDTQDRERSLTDARAEALRQFPYARQEELRGSTADEVLAAGRASHDHVTHILEEDRQRQERERQGGQGLDEEGRQRYGRGSGAGGPGEPPPAPPTGWDALSAEHDELMAKIRSGMPFDPKEVHGRVFAGAMNAIADRTVDKNLILIGRGKAASAEENRVHRGGVQVE